MTQGNSLNNYTISEAKDELFRILESYSAKGPDGSYLIPEVYRMPVYLVSPPGLGKTQIAEQVAGECGIGFVSYSLVHHTRNSLLGLPVIIDKEDRGKSTEYTVSEIIAAVWEQVKSGCSEGILFLDEFPCMSDTVAPAMLSFLQQKTLGKYKLPEGWVIVLAGNPPEYNRSVRRFDTAVIDRLRIIRIDYDTAAWLEYSEKSGIHPHIFEYISLHKDHLSYVDGDHREEAVTPRSWTSLSENLKIYEDLGLDADHKMIQQFIKAPEIAASFWKYYLSARETLSFDEMEAIYTYGRQWHKYREMIEDRSRRARYQNYKLAEKLCDYTIERVQEEIGEPRSRGKNGKTSDCSPAKGTKTAESIGNIFDFLTDLGEGESRKPDKTYAVMLKDRISSNKDVLTFISRNKVPAYNKLVLESFNVMTAAAL